MNNSVASAVRTVGIIFLAVGVVGSIIAAAVSTDIYGNSAFNFGTLFGGILATAVGGALIIGVSEIIELLDGQADSVEEINQKLGKLVSANQEAAKNQNGAEPQARRCEKCGAAIAKGHVCPQCNAWND